MSESTAENADVWFRRIYGFLKFTFILHLNRMLMDFVKSIKWLFELTHVPICIYERQLKFLQQNLTVRWPQRSRVVERICNWTYEEQNKKWKTRFRSRPMSIVNNKLCSFNFILLIAYNTHMKWSTITGL